MTVPPWYELALPMLELVADGATHETSLLRAPLAARFHLTDADLQELLPSGAQSRFNNRVGWARTALSKAGLLDAPERGKIRITDSGRALVNEQLSGITPQLLQERYEGYREFKQRGVQQENEPVVLANDELTAEEQLERAYQQLRQQVADDLIQRIKEQTPEFFERLVVELLVRLGYGGPQGEGVALGKTGDGGVDGVVRGDRLGLEEIYVQAKRWEGSVGGPQVQQFAGALAGVKATKGVFITTSTFTSAATDFVRKIDRRIALVDGTTLAELMIDTGLGISPMGTYRVWRIDSDFFTDV